MTVARVAREVAEGARRAARRAARVVTHPLWGELAAPVIRVTGFYVRGRQRWRSPREPGRAMPVVRPGFTLVAQAAIDEVVLATARIGRRPRSQAEFMSIEVEVAEALVQFAAAGWLDDPASYHEKPPPPEEVREHTSRFGSADYVRIEFESEYEPHPGEPGRDRWLEDVPNRTSYAWVLRHPEPRPWLVCVHGAGMGLPLIDLRAFRAEWLHEELGLNLAFPVLPRHGPRREGLPFGVGFPDDDLLDNVHALAQAAWDVRRLIAWLRTTQQAEVVGLKGISLGGYVASLVACLEDDLACVMVGVPAVDFADLFERHAPARFRSRPGYERLVPMSREIHRVVSPLAIAPLPPRERRFIYAGIDDRLVHPRAHVEVLWRHWDEPSIAWFEGSHVGFFFSRPVVDFVAAALRLSGLAAGEHEHEVGADSVVTLAAAEGPEAGTNTRGGQR